MSKNLSVIGLGKLGLTFALVLNEKGFNVKAFDINTSIIKAIKANKAPYKEPGLQELLNNSKKIKVVDSELEIINQTDTTFIVLPTPSKSNGEFSNKYLELSLKKCAEALKHKKTIICSQLYRQ